MTWRSHGWHAGLGLAMGYALSRSGFSEFSELHRMFTLRDARLILVFATAVILIGVAFRLGCDRAAPRSLHPGVIPGSVLFGAGWALCGACPAIALVQLGEGRWPALCTVAGLLVGTWLYAPIHRRWFRWDLGACG